MWFGRFVRASDVESSLAFFFFFKADAEKHTLAKYFLELTLLDYDMVHFNPSETAAAALCLSQLVLDGQKWVILS